MKTIAQKNQTRGRTAIRLSRISPLWAAAAAMVFFGAVAFAETAFAQPVKNIVLVHGAFADGSSWSKVIPNSASQRL